MNVRQMPLEELELLSYTDIAYELLKLDKKPKTTHALFKEVCDLLQISEDNMMDMIGDFYTTLTTDKRFILLDSAEWDLKEAIDIDSKALLLKVYEFTEVLASAALKKEPHLITNYVYELASMFHNYYGKHKILTDDIQMSKERLGLIKTVGITITNALKLIGVDAPEKM